MLASADHSRGDTATATGHDWQNPCAKYLVADALCI